MTAKKTTRAKSTKRVDRVLHWNPLSRKMDDQGDVAARLLAENRALRGRNAELATENASLHARLDKVGEHLTVLIVLEHVTSGVRDAPGLLAQLEEAGFAPDRLALLGSVPPSTKLRHALNVALPKRKGRIDRISDDVLSVALAAWSNRPGPAAGNVDKFVDVVPRVRRPVKMVAASTLVQAVTGRSSTAAALTVLWSTERPRRRRLLARLTNDLGTYRDAAYARRFRPKKKPES